MYLETRHASVGRGFWQRCESGKIVIDNDPSTKTIYIVKNGDVQEVITTTIKDGVKEKAHTRYGVDRRLWTNGKLTFTEYYQPGTNQARKRKGEWRKHTDEKLNGTHIGTLHQYAYGGGFRKEIFKYSNKREAYNVSYGAKHAEVYYPNRKLWLKIECFNKTRIDFAYKNSIFCGNPEESSSRYGSITPKDWDYNAVIKGGDYKVTCFDEHGDIRTHGVVENRQKKEIWIEDYKQIFYLSGVAVSEKLYYAKPEDIDPQDVLQIPNVQLRTSLLQKIGTEKVLQRCNATVIHKEGDYELYSVPLVPAKDATSWRPGDTEMRLLKVKCPSTGAFFTLRVPPTSATCEEARKWTFGYRRDDAIEFIQET